MTLEDWHRRIVSGERRGVVAEILRFELMILSQIFLLVVCLHRSLYRWGLLRPREVPAKVISIGNIVAGGTGKTPMTILLARELQKRGYKLGIVARNYKTRRRAGTGIVSNGERILMIPEEAGDEPYLMVKQLPGIPLVVDRDKTRAAVALHTEFKPELIVIDDAFQHFRLARQVDIVLIDGAHPFGYKHLLPRGLLREPVSALRRADIIVITRSQDAADLHGLQAQLHYYAPEAKIFTADLVVKNLRDFRTGETCPASFLTGKRLVMVSGVARPDSFENLVAAYNPKFAIRYRFPDHHHYQRAEMEVLRRLCTENRLELMVTTSKDAVKLSDVLNVPATVMVLEVEMELTTPGLADAVIKIAGLRATQAPARDGRTTACL